MLVKTDLFIILTLLASGAFVISRYKMFHNKNLNANFLLQNDSPTEVICSWLCFIAIVLGFLVHWWTPFPILIFSLGISELFLKMLGKKAFGIAGFVVILFSVLLLIQLWRIYFGPADEARNLAVYLMGIV